MVPVKACVCVCVCFYGALHSNYGAAHYAGEGAGSLQVVSKWHAALAVCNVCV